MTDPIRQTLLIDRLADLGPGAPNVAVKPLLASLTPGDVAPGQKDADMARAALSGLWLLHDFLDESHTLSQEIDTPTGSFWHAVMHRREPDPSNSKYWWRWVGPHPVLKQLADQAPALGYAYTTPFDFVDFCERVRGAGAPDEELAKRVQLLEWKLLFAYCLG
jgi:hypothetical protein